MGKTVVKGTTNEWRVWRGMEMKRMGRESGAKRVGDHDWRCSL